MLFARRAGTQRCAGEGDPVKSARVKLAAADRLLKRVSELWKAGRVPGSDYEAARADVAVREAELQAVLAARRAGGLRLGDRAGVAGSG